MEDAPAMKLVALQITFLGLRDFDGPVLGSVSVQSNATFDDLTEAFSPKIKESIEPDYLHCLVGLRSKIGTEVDGLARASRTKLLPDYPGFDRGELVAKITAWLIKPTPNNLSLERPKVVTSIPTLDQFLTLMGRLEKAAGYGRFTRMVKVRTRKRGTEQYEWRRNPRINQDDPLPDLEYVKLWEANSYANRFKGLIRDAGLEEDET